MDRKLNTPTYTQHKIVYINTKQIKELIIIEEPADLMFRFHYEMSCVGV